MFGGSSSIGRLLGLMAGLLGTLSPQWLTAAPDAAAAKPLPSLRLQEADDETAPLVPKTPRSTSTQQKLDAVSWYGTGRLLESRNELPDAIKAYRKALELEPQSLEIYRAIIPLALRLEQLEDALRWSLKAVELDPQDYELLSRIGVQLSRQRDLDEGLKYLERALQSPRLDKDSPTFVMLNVEIGAIYAAKGDNAKAADAYTVIFEALRKPEKFGLDFRTRSALLADPRTGYERVGTVLMEGKRLELAGEAFELAAKSGRVAAGNLSYHRARLMMLSDKNEEALEELQKYFSAQRQSKGRDAYQLLAEILTKLNRKDELIGRLEGLAESDPRNNQLQYYFADQLIEAGELERAKGIYEKVIQSGGDTSGYLGLAAVLRRMKRADELLDTLGRGLEKSGQDPEGLERLDTEIKAVSADAVLVDALVAAARAQAKTDPVQLTFAEAYLMSKVVLQLDRTDEAVEFYRLAAAQDRDRAPLALRELAELLMEAERYAEAADVYDDALQRKAPEELRARFYLGLTQSRELAGDTKAALMAVADARQAFPQLPIFEFQEGWIYLHSRQFDEAVKRFESVIKEHGQMKDLVRRCQFSLSNIYVMKGEMRKGEEILEKVLEEEPEDPAVNNDLGYLYADQGKHLEKAETMIRKAIASEPENAAYLDSLGWVLFKLNKIEEAIPHLEKATKIRTGGDATIWDHLADCYHRIGKAEAAKDAWTKALKEAEADKHPDAKLIERLKAKLQDPTTAN